MKRILTSSTTDTEIITSWLHSKQSILTKNTYNHNVMQFLIFIGCGLSEVKLEDIQGFVTMLTMKGYKPATIKNKLTTIKSLFSFCFEVGYLDANIASLVKMPKVQNKLNDKIINQNDIQLLVNNANSLRDKLIIKTLYSLGLRVSELINMKWSDFFIDGNFTKVNIVGKGQKERIILVSNNLYHQLLELKEAGNNFVFHAYHRNETLTRQAVNRLLLRLQKKIGLTTRISPHKFRHSHATESIKNGCDLSLLQQSLGHSSITTTQKYLNLRTNEGSCNFIDI